MSTLTSTETYDNRFAFAEELIALAASNPRIVAVCNDSVGSSNLNGFRERFPDRLVNVGIAEQNMVGVGAGLAVAGFIPFVCAAGPFLTGRALEQIKADVAYSAQPVILCGMSPGVAYGELGPTHHSVEDLSWLRALPGLDILVPADRRQTQQAVRSAVEQPRPLYIRVGRHKVPDVTGVSDQLRRGHLDVIRSGTDATIIAIGGMVWAALAAAESLAADGIGCRVINAASLVPFDPEVVLSAAAETRVIVTVEEANVAGGLGATVAMIVAGGDHPIQVLSLGLREFAPTGSVDFLLTRFGLTPEGVADAVREAVGRVTP